MYTYEKLLEIVKAELARNNGDRNKTIQVLFEKAENDIDLMIAFARHGQAILQACIEAENATFH